MNQITVYFVPCEPTPANGYNIQWRLFGSSDPYTDAGNFTTSPAVFTDVVNPDGSSYEGIIRSDCTESGESGENFGNNIPWSAILTGDPDNSSCDTNISVTTESSAYVNLGTFDLNVDGSALVDLQWETFGRPNRFTLYDNDVSVENTGWMGEADYPGPWGPGSLFTAQNGVISFSPVAGHEYKVRVEVGPADPDNFLSDSFNIYVACS